jgi:hypothetical protein
MTAEQLIEDAIIALLGLLALIVVPVVILWAA